MKNREQLNETRNVKIYEYNKQSPKALNEPC